MRYEYKHVREMEVVSAIDIKLAERLQFHLLADLTE